MVTLLVAICLIAVLVVFAVTAEHCGIESLFISFVSALVLGLIIWISSVIFTAKAGNIRDCLSQDAIYKRCAVYEDKDTVYYMLQATNGSMYLVYTSDKEIPVSKFYKCTENSLIPFGVEDE